MSKDREEDTIEVVPKKKSRIRGVVRGGTTYVAEGSKGMFNSFVVKPFGFRYVTDATSNLTGLTKESLSDALSFKKGKELYKLYTDDEKLQCEYSFDQMLRKEGWSEDKIQKGIKVLEFTKAIFLVLILGVLFYLVNYFVSTQLSISTFFSVFPSLAIIYLFSFTLTIVSWKVYRLRHRELLTHRKFMSIALREFGHFIPFWENQEDIDKEKERLNKKRANRVKLKKNEEAMKELKTKRNKNNKKEMK